MNIPDDIEELKKELADVRLQIIQLECADWGVRITEDWKRLSQRRDALQSAVWEREGYYNGKRLHKAPLGQCPTCDDMRDKKQHFHPSHAASERCESGKRNHCSCEICF